MPKVNKPEDFWANVDKTYGCWPWKRSKSKSGYGKTFFGGKNWRSHRLAYFLTYGHIDRLVCHKCDNRLCCNPSHLFLGTSADNSNDMKIKGRSAKPKGEMHPMSLLTTENVYEIRHLNSIGIPVWFIKDLYEVSEQAIIDVIKKRRWKHVQQTSSL